MKDNVVQVNLWDKNVGLLSWDDKRGCSVFQFDKDFMQYGWNIAPLVAPLDSVYVQRTFPMSGNREKLYAGLPAKFKHYILKFDTSRKNEFPFTRVEMAYYLMAKDAGINMMPSRLVEIEGTQNFLTQRFDRVEGRKIYTQTLAAMSSLADTYEDLFVVGRKLNLSAEEQSQQYRRMVFNVLAENVDDHTKNFSFVMYPNGEWHISPAYDIVFSADPDSHFYRNHELTVLGKRKNITKQDLMLFAQRQDIRNASSIIEEVEDVVMNFKSYAEKVEIDEYWIRKIERVLEENRK